MLKKYNFLLCLAIGICMICGSLAFARPAYATQAGPYPIYKDYQPEISYCLDWQAEPVYIRKGITYRVDKKNKVALVVYVEKKNASIPITFKYKGVRCHVIGLWGNNVIDPCVKTITFHCEPKIQTRNIAQTFKKVKKIYVTFDVSYARLTSHYMPKAFRKKVYYKVCRGCVNHIINCDYDPCVCQHEFVFLPLFGG